MHDSSGVGSGATVDEDRATVTDRDTVHRVGCGVIVDEDGVTMTPPGLMMT